MNIVDSSSNTVRRCESISAVKNVDSVENNRNLADYVNYSLYKLQITSFNLRNLNKFSFNTNRVS